MQIANKYLEDCKNIICKEIFNDPNLAEKCHVSYGFPSISALAPKVRKIGEAWQHSGTEAIFINPCLFKKGNHIKVLGVLIHELIHIQIGVNKGHRNGFKAAMNYVGLTGKPTATEVGKNLLERLNALNLPKMPDLNLDYNRKKKDSTRLILLMCSCERKIRASNTVIDKGGITCSLCNTEFKTV
tara:strand:+ start:3093 stop:3647 length:555 start_codon:yes stop_codon:yes gene_type:complete